MPRKSPLDDQLIKKIANKLEKQDDLAVRKAVSAKASKLHVSPQAAQVLMAHELGIRTAVLERKLTPEIKAEIRASSSRSAATLVPMKSVRSNIRGTSTPNRNRNRPWREDPIFIAIFSVLVLGLISTYIAHKLGWLK